jgi:hypothetical protein
MPYTAQIIQLINDHLLSTTLCDSRFSGASIQGIATDTTERDSNGIRVYPAVFDISGNGVKLSPDDTYPIQIYHKLLHKTYAVKVTSTGDRANIMIEKTDAKMVVAGWTDRLQLTQEDLEALIVSNFPDQIRDTVYRPLRLQHLSVSLQSCQLDRSQVFREEYKGIPYQVAPAQILFAIRYQIESTYQKGCFIITDCQPQYQF